ncbi:PTS sugar transporter subunit IIA [Eubacterium barkeri]|uniref:Mannitol-specific phosphotransferase enzyme IIA component n=1 Tax=Eubacterium barkeri TaxID=1528 RepID=A0A1H3G2B7_EUBBA|nr:PTS sugar transporter subunit IIA [Eubacterium barkeri]SDX97391.1 PTS system D-mannitol-specific IIA component, Fru family [Eubacterium barkeri]
MEILQEKNIIINCSLTEKMAVVKAMGQLLYESGYVTEAYIQGMIDKEGTMNTYLGNDIAIPHGIESVRDQVLVSGLGIMTFPQGIDWNGQKVRVVIGIAGKEEEHIEVLAHIAVTLSEPQEVDALVASDAKGIHQMLAL